MTDTCLEVLIFKVGNAEQAEQARKAAQLAARRYSGFLSWTAYQSSEDRNMFADLVLWKDQKTAKEAIAQIKKDPAFAALVSEMDGLVTASCFQAVSHVETEAMAA